MSKKVIIFVLFLGITIFLNAAIESITIEGPDVIYPGSENKYSCIARYDYGGSNGYFVSADWKISNIKPEWVDSNKYLSIGFNRIEVAYHVDYEFEFTLKCTYEGHEDEKNIIVAPSPPRCKSMTKAFLWWLPGRVIHEEFISDVGEEVVHNAIFEPTLKIILGGLGNTASKAGSLFMGILTSMPTAGIETRNDIKLIADGIEYNHIAIKKNYELMYMVSIFQGTDQHYGPLTLKLYKQDEGNLQWEHERDIEILSSIEYDQNIDVATKYIVFPKEPLVFEESGQYKLMLGNRSLGITVQGDRVNQGMYGTSNLIEVTSNNFDEFIHNHFSILVFITANCEACGDVISSLEDITEEMSDVVVGQMDVQKNQQFINKIRLRVEDGQPTIVMFSKGEIQDGLLGYYTTDKLKEYIQGVKEKIQLWKDVEDGKISFLEAFDFTLKDLNGNDVTLSEIGGLIILDFWTTWCPPCKDEIPYLVEFYNAYKNRGLTILGVSAEKPSELQSFKSDLSAQGTDITYPILIDRDRKISQIFGIKSIPTTFFISPDGKLLEKEVGFTEEYVPKFKDLIENNLLKTSDSSENENTLYEMFKENWESGDIDLKTWSIMNSCDDTPAITSHYSFKSDYSLVMIDHTGYDSPQIQNRSPLNLSKGMIQFHFFENYNNTSGACHYWIKTIDTQGVDCDNESILCRISINSKHELTLNYPDQEPLELASLELNEWYKISFEFNLKTNQLAIMLNKEIIYQGKLSHDFNGNVNYLEFGANSYWDNGPEYYIDDITISQNMISLNQSNKLPQQQTRPTTDNMAFEQGDTFQMGSNKGVDEEEPEDEPMNDLRISIYDIRTPSFGLTSMNFEFVIDCYNPTNAAMENPHGYYDAYINGEYTGSGKIYLPPIPANSSRKYTTSFLMSYKDFATSFINAVKDRSVLLKIKGEIESDSGTIQFSDTYQW